ncbi:MAG: T9SS type A sorting domain-containing protein [Fluviicola sp.]|nr:T9SS type A sorting domain-containing protein [Fluviicola sp.]
MRQLFLFGFLFLTTVSTAQVQYSDFSLVQQNKVVLIRWTVNSGSLCDGTVLYRSIDGAADVIVGEIPGICGSEIENKEYSLIDQSPELNATNRYYIRFGFSEYSEEKEIYVKYLDPERLYLGPNPSETTMYLEWNDQFHDEYILQVIDDLGTVVFEQAAITGSSFELDVSTLATGFYTVLLINSKGEKTTEKIIKL